MSFSVQKGVGVDYLFIMFAADVVQESAEPALLIYKKRYLAERPIFIRS